MSLLLWYGDGDNDAVSLGSTIQTLPSFSEVSEVLKGQSGFDELQSIPGFAEQNVTKWWLRQVRHQAKVFLSRYRNEVSSGTAAMLSYLVQQLDRINP